MISIQENILTRLTETRSENPFRLYVWARMNSGKFSCDDFKNILSDLSISRSTLKRTIEKLIQLDLLEEGGNGWYHLIGGRRFSEMGYLGNRRYEVPEFIPKGRGKAILFRVFSEVALHVSRGGVSASIRETQMGLSAMSAPQAISYVKHYYRKSPATISRHREQAASLGLLDLSSKYTIILTIKQTKSFKKLCTELNNYRKAGFEDGNRHRIANINGLWCWIKDEPSQVTLTPTVKSGRPLTTAQLNLLLYSKGR
jgi:hypothetical protein